MRFRAFVALAALPCAACSTVIEGRSQKIEVVTDPPGATCILQRDGESLGRIDPTPGALMVRKTSRNIDIECAKDGVGQAKATSQSGFAAAVLGNVLAGGLIGIVVDMSTGAGVKYDSPVTLALAGAAPSANRPIAEQQPAQVVIASALPSPMPVVMAAPKPIPPGTPVDIAATQRETLLANLMPEDGPKAPVARPPTDPAALQRWMALLDSVEREELLDPESVRAEKAALIALN